MPATEWYQQYLVEPPAYELNVRIGIVPRADHVQALVELTDPTTSILIGQASWPHVGMHRLEMILDWTRLKALDLVDTHVDPF